MEWVVFTYSLPSKAGSSPRVTLWRRLRRLGAVTPAGSIYVLPAREDCIEAFQWLAQEIRQARGDALVMHVGQFAGLPDPQVIALFQTARAEDYAVLETEAATLEQTAAAADDPEERSRIQEMLERLRRRHAEIVRVDYFDCPEGTRVAARFGRIQQALAPAAVEQVVPAAIAAYHAARWVTRPRPHVDRLACAWLIRRFVNPAAPIRYAAQPEPGEVAFDMVDAQFGHMGSLCTFETMLRAFGLDEPALQTMAEVVHEIDLRDGQYARPETVGIDAVLAGWQRADLADAERESRGLALFEGLYAAFAHTTGSHTRPGARICERALGTTGSQP